MGVNSLPKTVTRQRRSCDLNPGPSAPESSTLTTRLPSHPIRPRICLFNSGYPSCHVAHTPVVPVQKQNDISIGSSILVVLAVAVFNGVGHTDRRTHTHKDQRTSVTTGRILTLCMLCGLSTTRIKCEMIKVNKSKNQQYLTR